MASAEDILNIARSQIGVTSGRKYFEEMGDRYVGQAWCARFGRWVYWKGGVDSHWPYDYAFDERDVPRQWRLDKYDLKPAAALCFDWDGDAKGDHFGIVESVQDWGCATIEGNTAGGKVARQQRLWSEIICGLMPDLDPGKLYTDGVAGYLTISEWQRQRKTTVDGTISGQSYLEDKFRSNVVSVEHIPNSNDILSNCAGSALIVSVQKFLKAKGYYKGLIDGCWGYETSLGIQRYLKALGYYDYLIDGYFGRISVIALQESLNDGKWK